MKASITTNFSADKVYAKLVTKADKAQKRLDARVLSDSNYWCPLDTGTLVRSAELATKIGSGQVEWRTPYADKQYWGNFDHTKSLKPHATSRWFETAKARYEQEWQEVVREIITAD